MPRILKKFTHVGLVVLIAAIALMVLPVIGSSTVSAQACDSAAVAESIVRNSSNSTEALNAFNQSCLLNGIPFWGWHTLYQTDICRGIDASDGLTHGLLDGRYYDFASGLILFNPESSVTGQGQVIGGASVPIQYWNSTISDLVSNTSPYGCWYAGIGAGNPNPTPIPPIGSTCTDYGQGGRPPVGVTACYPGTNTPFLTVLNRCSYLPNGLLDAARSEESPGYPCSPSIINRVN